MLQSTQLKEYGKWKGPSDSRKNLTARAPLGGGTVDDSDASIEYCRKRPALKFIVFWNKIRNHHKYKNQQKIE